MTLNRRTLLRGSVAAGLIATGGTVLGAGKSASADVVPTTAATRRTFLLVHGGWGNAANFHPLLEELELRGHRALAIDLPGHGTKAKFPTSYLAQNVAGLATEPSPVAGNALSDYVSYTLSIASGLAALPGDLRPVVGVLAGARARGRWLSSRRTSMTVTVRSPAAAMRPARRRPRRGSASTGRNFLKILCRWTPNGVAEG